MEQKNIFERIAGFNIPSGTGRGSLFGSNLVNDSNKFENIIIYIMDALKPTTEVKDPCFSLVGNFAIPLSLLNEIRHKKLDNII